MTVTISAETAAFLLRLVNQLQLNVGSPDFDDVVACVLKARSELSAMDPRA